MAVPAFQECICSMESKMFSWLVSILWPFYTNPILIHVAKVRRFQDAKTTFFLWLSGLICVACSVMYFTLISSGDNLVTWYLKILGPW